MLQCGALKSGVEPPHSKKRRGRALLTVNNFFQGNVLTFGDDLSGSINNTNSFKFDNAFTSSWNQGTSTFTITAIPEPSTYVAAAGLLGLLVLSLRRRAASQSPQSPAV